MTDEKDYLSDNGYDIFMPLFRGFFTLIFYLWCLGFNVLGWQIANINYRLILNFNKHASTPT